MLVVSLPLTRATRILIPARELSLMRETAILVNFARAAILDEGALSRHLGTNPSFTAALDAWWHQPTSSGSFATRHPFFEPPNLVGSPHNSAITHDSPARAARHAAENLLRFLRGDRPHHLVVR